MTIEVSQTPRVQDTEADAADALDADAPPEVLPFRSADTAEDEEPLDDDQDDDGAKHAPEGDRADLYLE